jgi:signal peptidase II
MTSVAVRIVLVVAIVATIGCDHATKHIAATTLAGMPARSYLGDTIRLQYAENPGGFLSLGADLPPIFRTGVFTVGTGLALLALTIAALRLRWTGWPLVGLTLFVAGGTSNWMDRVARGSVVDFINVGIGPIRTGIFNVADMALMVGVGIIVVVEVRRVLSAEHDAPPEQAPD